MTSAAKLAPIAPSDILLHILRRRWLIIAIIVLATAAAYWPVLTCGFVNYDDDKHILANPRFNPPTLKNALAYWTERGFFGLYIPVTYTAWTVVAQTARRGDSFSPAVFHVANLLVHACNAVLVYFILQRLLRGKPFAAMLGALMFALHPLQVEAVAWVSGFRDVFGGLLALLTILRYLDFLDASEPPARRNAYLIAAGAFALALLSKPTAVVLPLVLLIIDTLIRRRPWRAALTPLVPLIVMSLLAAAWARIVQPSILLSNPVPLAARPLVAADSVGFYLWKLAWPARLVPDYGRHDYRGLLSLAPAAILVALILLRLKTPLLLAGYLIFLAALLPVLGFVPFDFQEISNVADRYMYLPMLGAALALAAVMSRFDSVAIRAGAFAVLIAFGIRTFEQAQIWRSTQTLFARNLEVNPRSWLACNNLGAEEADPAAAERILRRSVMLKPDYADARINLGAVLAEQGRLAEAIEQFEIAIRLRPDLPEARGNLEKARRARDVPPASR